MTSTDEICGAWGGCTLPAGHNRGWVDIPSNHQPPEGVRERMLNDIVGALRLAKEYAVEADDHADLARFRDAEKSAMELRAEWGRSEATHICTEAIEHARAGEAERLATMIEEQATLWNDYAVPRTRVRAVTALIRGEEWER